MAIDLKRLTQRAFYREQPVRNATQAIATARDEFVARTHTEGVSFEIVAATEIDEAWVQRSVLHPLVYLCESEGRPIPLGSGVFVSLFISDALWCIAVPDVIAWATDELGVTAEELRAQYGTHEIETALR
jgi:hypothetical protein